MRPSARVFFVTCCLFVAVFVLWVGVAGAQDNTGQADREHIPVVPVSVGNYEPPLLISVAGAPTAYSEETPEELRPTPTTATPVCLAGAGTGVPASSICATPPPTARYQAATPTATLPYTGTSPTLWVIGAFLVAFGTTLLATSRPGRTGE